jgi:hypothetical protein
MGKGPPPLQTTLGRRCALCTRPDSESTDGCRGRPADQSGLRQLSDADGRESASMRPRLPPLCGNCADRLVSPSTQIARIASSFSHANCELLVCNCDKNCLPNVTRLRKNWAKRTHVGEVCALRFALRIERGDAWSDQTRPRDVWSDQTRPRSKHGHSTDHGSYRRGVRRATWESESTRAAGRSQPRRKHS